MYDLQKNYRNQIIRVGIRCLALVMLFWVFNQDAKAQAIIKTSVPEGWVIKTDNSVYQLFLGADKKVRAIYYGVAEQQDYLKENAAWTMAAHEVPVRGGAASRTPAVEVVFEDGTRDVDLIYKSSEIFDKGEMSILKIVQQDSHYPLEVISYFKVFPEFDIIEKWLEVKNTGNNGGILIENLLSGSVALPHDNYLLTHMSGNHMHEFQLQHEPLHPGVKTVQQKEFKSNSTAPWFVVGTDHTTSERGPVWFGSIHYSGNWALQFDKAFQGTLQLLGGINFWDTNWTLEPGRSFTAPKVSFGYSDDGTDRASLNLSSYIKKHILPERFREELRPVLYNSWEATYYDVNEKQQMALADVAKDIGIELFVVDDGWFKDRTDGRSQSGLGNFDLDMNKFPNGLKPLIDHVHSLGMKFGLWVEPENVNPNSDVYRAHPDWVFQFPNRETNKFRKILNLANEEAYHHLLNILTTLLSENSIDFIKWDQNNLLVDPGWKNAPAGKDREARIRHTENVYRLVDELRKRFPDVIFETCASGGGRVDLGMLSKMDQAWVSDNTDPVDRLFIQHGYQKMLPANTMVSWVTSMTRHLPVSLDYRFDVSMAGVLGVGADITKWNEQEKDIARQKIAFYKTIRPIVQWGDYHSLVSPFETNRSASQYISQDKGASIVFCYNMAKYLSGSQYIDRGTTNIRLKGLHPNYDYSVRKVGNEKDAGKVYKGDFLMNVGIKWPLGEQAFQSVVLHIERKK